MITIDLPWPPRALHPNAARGHWAKRAGPTKASRNDAAWAARSAGVRKIYANSLKVTITFAPPDNRRRDTDGMLSASKAYLDGIADAIGVDDSKWELAIKREAPAKPGRVRIEIEVAA